MPSPSVISFLGISLKKDWESDPAANFLKEHAHTAMSKSSVLHVYRGKAVDPNAPPAAEIVVVSDSLASAQANKEEGAKDGSKDAFEKLADPNGRSLANIFELNDDFTTVAAAPVVLLSKWDVPAGQKDAFDAEWAKLSAAGPPKHDGLIGGTHGWGTEETNGIKTFLVVTGWESVEKAEAQKAGAVAASQGLDAIAKVDVRYTNLEKVK